MEREGCSISGRILPSSDYQRGYDVVERLLGQSAQERDRIQRIAESVRPDLPASMLARLEAVAAEQRKNLVWSIANSFVQDIRVMTRLRARAPFIRMEQAKGYLVLSSRQYTDATTPSAVSDQNLRIMKSKALPGFPPGISPEELLGFFDKAFQLSRAKAT